MRVAIVRLLTYLLVLTLLLPAQSFAECSDPDGDGYGWNGERPCRTRRVRAKDNPATLSVRNVRVSSVTDSSARITATFSSNSSGTIHFGKTPDFGKVGPYTGMFKRKIFNQTIDNLEAGTTYYFKVEARIGTNRAYSNVGQFTTKSSSSSSTTTKIPTTTTSTKPVPTADLIGTPSVGDGDTEVVVSFDFSNVAQAQLEYGKSKSSTEFGLKESSFDHKRHDQVLRNLQPDTLYHYRIHYSGQNENSKDKVSKWYNFRTDLSSNSGIVYHDDLLGTRVLSEPFENTKPKGINTRHMSYGFHAGEPPPARPDIPYLNIDIPKNAHWGSGTRNLLPHIQTEGWLAYDIRVLNWKNSKYSTKLLGLAANYSAGIAKPRDYGYSHAHSWPYYRESAGGNGGGGSERAPFGPNGQGKSWSLRGELTGYQIDYSNKGMLGFEVYHSDSPTVLADGRQFGEAAWLKPKTINGRKYEHTLYDGEWHRVKIYLKLNDIGKNNAIVRAWFDWDLPGRDYVAYERTNYHFTDNPLFRNIAIYNNVWHGGHHVAPDDFQVQYANIRTWAGPEDLDR